MKVKLVYRNYKPLHKIYESLAEHPPRGVRYVVPAAKTNLAKLYPVYLKIRFFSFGKLLIHFFEKFFFVAKDNDSGINIYQYINIIDENPPSKPFVVDIEHAASLVSFTGGKKELRRVNTFLQDRNCKRIICLSRAAQVSLKKLLANNYKIIASKVEIVYPALTKLDTNLFKPDYSYISDKPSCLKLLFVGNKAYLKGLEELLSAVKKINSIYSPKVLELHIVSSDAHEVFNRYKLENTYLYKPQFSKREIYSKFFMPADVFISPTKEDTFGMAILDALSCGTPVIATKQFAIPELIEDKIDGWLLQSKNPILDCKVIPGRRDMQRLTSSNLDKDLALEIEKVLTVIIEGEFDMAQFAKNARMKFEPGGKFAISTRNAKLLSIYQKTHEN
ncbi:MAG: glycosyltransferase family 4 protein [Candidatus Saccharimonadales bacterium]